VLRALALVLAAATPASAADLASLRVAIEDIRAAGLAGDPPRAAPHLAADLVLVSQSGRLYGRDDALADLGSGIESWVVEDQLLQEGSGEARVVSVIRRKRTGSEEGRFRVLQVWRVNPEGRWQLSAQASVRMAP
jgi:ketosteroid isomerase-like protein